MILLLYEGEYTKGYVFHGDPERVFKEFFGGDNPYSGIIIIIYIFTSLCITGLSILQIM